jgi:effector-binding domain-containing protein
MEDLIPIGQFAAASRLSPKAPASTTRTGSSRCACRPRPVEKTLPAVEVANTTAAGDDAQFPAVLGAYDAVARWATARGRELDGSPREIYVGPPTGPDARLEIAWPIR